MKKALADSTPSKTDTRTGFTRRARLIGGLALLGLTAGLGLFASRPAHTAGGPIAVSVANTPLSTTNDDNPDQQPFQVTLSPQSSTSSQSTVSYTVPAGKRLVIDYYSAQLAEYPSGGYGLINLAATVDGNTAYYPVSPAGSIVPSNQTARIYADSGTLLSATVIESSGTSSAGQVILSGHFVNVK